MREKFLQFLNQCFVDAKNRRSILMHWHATTPKTLRFTRAGDGEETVTTHFAAFITALLYEPMHFSLTKTQFTLFGPTLPVHRNWLWQNPAEEDVWTLFEKNAKELFDKVKECANGDYVYECPPKDAVSSIVTVECRRQLVRDFCWLVRDTNDTGMMVALIAAIQTVLSRRHGMRDAWLANLHQACQGRCDLNEVLCWDTNQYDVHTTMKSQTN